MKKCIKCNKRKLISSFHIKKNNLDGHDSRCKSCIKIYKAKAYKLNPQKWRTRTKTYRSLNRKKDLDYNRNLKYLNRYGITYQDKLAMLKLQSGKCKLCFIDIKTKSYVDHNHKTGKIRGLLCNGCNAGIGMLKEDINVLNRAIEYLENE